MYDHSRGKQRSTGSNSLHIVSKDIMKKTPTFILLNGYFLDNPLGKTLKTSSRAFPVHALEKYFLFVRFLINLASFGST